MLNMHLPPWSNNYFYHQWPIQTFLKWGTGQTKICQDIPVNYRLCSGIVHCTLTGMTPEKGMRHFTVQYRYI